MCGILSFNSQDDLSTLSGESTSFGGDVTVSLQNEDILPDYTIRTVKVRLQQTAFPFPGQYAIYLRKNLFFLLKFQLTHRKSSGKSGGSAAPKSERFVTQLIFPRWPEDGLGSGLPERMDLLNFVKASYSCRQSVGGNVLVHSR